MNRSRHAVSALVLATIATVVPAISATPAAAAEVLDCNTSASLFIRKPDTSLTVYQHDAPENGDHAWSGDQVIYSGAWDDVTLGGPDNVMYEVTPEGNLNYYKWLGGTNWENGGHALIAKTGFTGWNKHTLVVDQIGDFYGLHADGSLRWYRITKQDTTFTTTERTIATGWGEKFDKIWPGDGPGTLFARTKDSKLRYFRYDAVSQRWTVRDRSVGESGWHIFSDIASVGAGVFYGIDSSTGNLHWYRYTGTDWAEGSSRVVGFGGWKDDWLIEGRADSCKILGRPGLSRPIVPEQRLDALAPVQQPDGRMSFFYVNSRGQLIVARQREASNWELLDFQPFVGHSGFTGVPGAALRSDNRIEVLANSSEDAEYRGRTQDNVNGAWSPEGRLNAHGGFMLSNPVVVAGADKVLTVFATDVNGNLFQRVQSPTGFTGWLDVPGGTGLTTDFSVVRSGTGFQVVTRAPDNSVKIAKYENGALGAWRTLGTGAVGRPAAVVANSDTGDVQVFVRRTDNRMHTQVSVNGTFPGTWTSLHTREFTGSPAAVMRSSGQIEVAARTADGVIYIAGQLAPGEGFGEWITKVDFEETAVDPAGVTTQSGEAAFAWRTPQGLIGFAHPRQSQVPARSAATTQDYTGAVSKP